MRREIMLLGLLIAILAALLYFSSAFKQVSEEDARKFFIEDLAGRYPNADVRQILEVTKVGEGKDSYLLLKARVTKGLSTPCPERIHIYYNYPPQNFVTQPPEYITRNCVVCADVQNCILAWPEEAIIASHKYAGGDEVEQYIRTYPDAKPKPKLLDEYNGIKNVWEVTWDSQDAPYSISAHMKQNEKEIMGVQTIQK